MGKDDKELVFGLNEEAVGRVIHDVLSSSVVTGAVRVAMDTRERATQIQEATLGILNLPSAADLERLTRRIRNVSQRLEAIEDAVDRVDERVANFGDTDDNGVKDLVAQLDRIEAALAATEAKLNLKTEQS